MKRLPELRRKVEHARETHTFVVLDPDEADLLVSAAEALQRRDDMRDEFDRARALAMEQAGGAPSS